jgi:hypothetical protein
MTPLLVQVGAQIKKPDVRGDKVLWLGSQALDATAFIKNGKRHKCNFRVLKSLLYTVDRFIQAILSK